MDYGAAEPHVRYAAIQRNRRRPLMTYRLRMATVVVLVAASTVASQAQARRDTHTVSVAAGVTFALPTDFAVQDGRPSPITHSWLNRDGSISLDVIPIQYPDNDVSAVAKEFEDWPDVGRSMIAGFGRSSAKTIGEASNTKCSYHGIPLRRDPERVVMQLTVTLTCGEPNERAVIRTQLFSVFTRSRQLLIRIDAEGSNGALQDSIASTVWQTIAVLPEARIASPIIAVSPRDSAGALVSGGAGFRLTDYRLVRVEALIGEFIGALIASLAVGALLSALLLRAGLGPALSLSLTQLVLVALRFWGDAHDGVWELDWLTSLVPAVIAIVILHRWAKRRWEQQQQRRSLSGPVADRV